ncbi:hypothetical protein KK062_17830 [Fulvivirgaceae bacterium PWU5]|uniref:DUF3575 domain-containing protein n=1 Tax=Dawidia cretensis TaxID=2782350 RepID=A0AAP2GQW3_9BACT|nr:hypothetical protein [Dawidia cretensis]
MKSLKTVYSTISLFFALLLINTAAFAQSTDEYDLAVPRHAFKFSPGHLMNFHPTVQFAYEQRVARRLTLQGEYGHVINAQHNDERGFANYDDEWNSDRKGYKTKLEAHYYVYATKNGRFAWYSAAELYYNHISYTKQRTTSEYYGETPDTRYEKIHRQRVHYDEGGFNFKFGFVYTMGPVLLDINAGLGHRFIQYNKILPVFKESRDWFEFGPREESRNQPGLAMGVRIGYRFPWRRAT